jgi:NitT/TauT family transport system permease protein
MLPGIGSYIATAINQRDLAAIGYAVLVMFVVILLYDQLLFRPLLAWSRKFQADPLADEDNVRPWFLIVLQRARLFDLVQAGVLELNRIIDDALAGLARRRRAPVERRPRPEFDFLFDIALLGLAAAAAIWLITFIRQTVDLGEIGWVFALGLATAARVLTLIGVASLIWVPIGVAIGLRPHLADRVQPIVQFLAAFPANLFFPVAVVLILRFQLNPEIWLSPLMILGTQWYILFNVIVGTRRIVECEHRVRGGPMGGHDADRDRHRRLYRSHYGRWRQRPYCARHRRPLPLCSRLQPAALASAL